MGQSVNVCVSLCDSSFVIFQIQINSKSVFVMFQGRYVILVRLMCVCVCVYL